MEGNEPAGRRQPRVRSGLKERLADPAQHGETRVVASESVWERDDVDAILKGIWDIKMLLIQLVQLLGDDEEEADE